MSTQGLLEVVHSTCTARDRLRAVGEDVLAALKIWQRAGSADWMDVQQGIAISIDKLERVLGE